MAKKIALFGDSILKGVIYGADKRYHISKDIDWKGIEETLDIELENFSKMGNCIESGRINLEKFLTNCKNVKGVVLEYGGNDSDYFWEQVSQNPSKENLPKTALDEFRRDLTSMITLLKKNHIRPILMTLPPIIAERYFNFIVSLGHNSNNIKEFLGDVQIIYRRHELYSNEIVKVAREQNVDLVDVRSKFLESNNLENLICEDGIHPNIDGQKLIVQTFSNYFDNAKLRAKREKQAKKSEKALKSAQNKEVKTNTAELKEKKKDKTTDAQKQTKQEKKKKTEQQKVAKEKVAKEKKQKTDATTITDTQNKKDFLQNKLENIKQANKTIAVYES